jgi:hypothetical protein
VLLGQFFAHESGTQLLIERARQLDDLRLDGGGELSIPDPAALA